MNQDDRIIFPNAIVVAPTSKATRDYWRKAIETLKSTGDIRMPITFTPSAETDRLLDRLTNAAVEKEMRMTELRCQRWCRTTGLAAKDGTIVHFKGKKFPQWVGAVTRFDPGRLPK